MGHMFREGIVNKSVKYATMCKAFISLCIIELQSWKLNNVYIKQNYWFVVFREELRVSYEHGKYL